MAFKIPSWKHRSQGQKASRKLGAQYKAKKKKGNSFEEKLVPILTVKLEEFLRK